MNRVFPKNCAALLVRDDADKGAGLAKPRGPLAFGEKKRPDALPRLKKDPLPFVQVRLGTFPEQPTGTGFPRLRKPLTRWVGVYMSNHGGGIGSIPEVDDPVACHAHGWLLLVPVYRNPIRTSMPLRIQRGTLGHCLSKKGAIDRTSRNETHHARAPLALGCETAFRKAVRLMHKDRME